MALFYYLWSTSRAAPATDVAPIRRDGAISPVGKVDNALPLVVPSGDKPELDIDRSALVQGNNKEEVDSAPPPPELAPTEAELWTSKYKGFSGPDMHYQRDILTNEVGAQVNRIGMELFDAGFYEVIGVGDAPPPEAYQTGKDLVAFRDTADGMHLKVVLDERTYPELYALRREAQWLHYQGALAIQAKGLAVLPPSNAVTGTPDLNTGKDDHH